MAAGGVLESLLKVFQQWSKKTFYNYSLEQKEANFLYVVINCFV